VAAVHLEQPQAGAPRRLGPGDPLHPGELVGQQGERLGGRLADGELGAFIAQQGELAEEQVHHRQGSS